MDKCKNLYILLTHSGTTLSHMVKLYTREPYSHVSLSFDESLRKMYSFGRKKPRNPLIGGFVREDIESGIYTIFTETEYALYTMPVSEEQYENLRKTITEFEQMSDVFKYNLIGLIGIMVGYPINRANSYFCSQFVAYTFEQSGISVFDKPFGLVTPKDFRTNDSFSLLKSGKLSYFRTEPPMGNSILIQ